ncbi:MAG: zinc ABC transporter substrate-binding protein, partial [Chlamydiia bacterium]|nr:zinc ABC transporter substrate-binding protein [Chlamydiia bacterium]
MKIKILFPVIALFVVLFSCSSKKNDSRLNEWMSNTKKVKVLSTTSQVGDLVAFIGGDKVDSLVLIPADLDPHSYELVKGDGEKLTRAQLIFSNGLGLEHGASLSSLLRTSNKAISLGDVIRKEAPNLVLEKNGVIDPHLWMDLAIWSIGTYEIEKQLSRIDPASSSYYSERGEILRGMMREKDLELRILLQSIPEKKRFLVTSHDAFRYFAKAYLAVPGEKDWEARFTAPEGLAPDGQLSPVDLQEVIHFLQKHQISVLFPESNLSRGVIAKIVEASQEMGHPVRLCKLPLYGDSTSG